MLNSKLRLGFTIFIDVVLINLAVCLAYLTRASFDINGGPEVRSEYFGSLLQISLTVTFVRLTVYLLFKLHKPVWQYASVREFMLIVGAASMGTVLLIGVMNLHNDIFESRGVILLDWSYNLLLFVTVKFSPRIFDEFRRYLTSNPPKSRVLIVGAGEAGVEVLREIRAHPEKGYVPIGFVDDDPRKQGKSIRGIEVLGTINELAQISRRRKIDEIVIAIPSAPGSRIREIVQQCEKRKAKFKIVPSVHAILDGKVSINQIREVRVEDLLNRDTSKIDLADVSKYITGKRVMVTGAGGSIGSELCRQIANFDPELLLLFGRGENSLYNIEMELDEQEVDVNRKLIIGNIRDLPKVEVTMGKYRPDLIFHTAAHKHVRFMEFHPDEAVKNNIIGTKNVVDASIKYHAKKFIFVSTDKAVNPTSVLGVTKRITEMLVQSKAKQDGTKFIAVRFGNVIDSRGSVLPKFRRQIARGGPVTVTHREVIRYFMTIPEAVQLLIQAGSMGNGGEIFVLDMGEPVKIADLARDLITLSGLEVGKDIKIKFIGLRPGEKLYEELLTVEEGVTATKHQRIFVAQPKSIDEDKLLEEIDKIASLAEKADFESIISKLQDIVPSYKPNRLIVSDDAEKADKKSDLQIISLPVDKIGHGKVKSET